jgi:hypothetical protein
MGRRITTRDLEKAIEVLNELQATALGLSLDEADALDGVITILDRYVDRGGVE